MRRPIPHQPSCRSFREKRARAPRRELKKISDSNLQHLFTLAFKIGDWLYTLWNYYFVISTALVGWILAKPPSVLPERKVWFCAVYVLVWLVNLGLISYNFGFLKVVIKAAEKEFAEDKFFKSDELNERLRHITRYVWWMWPLLIFHVAIAAFVVTCILSLTP